MLRDHNQGVIRKPQVARHREKGDVDELLEEAMAGPRL